MNQYYVLQYHFSRMQIRNSRAANLAFVKCASWICLAKRLHSRRSKPIPFGWKVNITKERRRREHTPEKKREKKPKRNKWNIFQFESKYLCYKMRTNAASFRMNRVCACWQCSCNARAREHKRKINFILCKFCWISIRSTHLYPYRRNNTKRDVKCALQKVSCSLPLSLSQLDITLKPSNQPTNQKNCLIQFKWFPIEQSEWQTSSRIYAWNCSSQLKWLFAPRSVHFICVANRKKAATSNTKSLALSPE